MNIWKFISLFIKPKSGRYLEPVRLMPKQLGTTDCPFLAIYLIGQPNESKSIGVRFDYRLPKGCVTHHAQFLTTDESGDVSTSLWLQVGNISGDGIIYMMNSLDVSLVNNGLFLFRFSDGHWPVCTYHQYEVYLCDYKIT